MELTGCPECGATAEVVDDGLVPSTAGPVRVVRVRCANRHWFHMTRDRLPADAPPVREPDRATLPRQ